MIGYTSIGTNNLATSGAFYDVILGMMGAKRVMEMEDFIVWSRAEGEANFSIHLPFDGRRATVGNGVMIALQGKSKDEVDAVYSKAISVGAESEGEPGARGGDDSGFYAAYFRDPDGNKINIHYMS
ncbi:glyoxalase [Thalassospira sp. MCCC 1A03138]|nr:glyoxalase [Thalassospira sp. MCCC 1A03138]